MAARRTTDLQCARPHSVLPSPRGGVLAESARAPGGVSVRRGGGVMPDVGEDGCECVAAVGGTPCSGSAGAAWVVSAGT